MQKSPPNPWPVPVPVETIDATGQHFDLVADDAVRAAVARLAGLRELPRLEASFDLTPHGSGGVHVTGRVSATVGQNCVVTLEPLSNDIEAAIDLIFVAQPAPVRQAAEPDAKAKPRDVKWNDPEPLAGDTVDLGALTAEFLMVGLDPYPRKPGAVFAPPHDPTPEESPFAALGKLTKRGNGP
jgi:hypothetical protein